MKVLLAGAGAVGQFLAAKLQDAGHDPVCWTTPRHVAPLRALTITGATEGTWDVTAVTEPPMERFDAAILTCKSMMTQHLAPHLAHHGAVASLQNGLGNAQKVARFVAAERVVVGITSHGIMLQEPGQLRHAGTGATLVGPRTPAATEAAQTVANLFADAGLGPEMHDEMRGFVWRKALINHAVNAVAALHDVTNGQLLDDEGLHALSKSMLAEGERLAHAGRVPLPAGDLRQLLDSTLEKTRPNRVSMLQDVDAKRPTEIESLTGRLVRLGEKLLVSMPRSESVYGRLKDMEASYLGADAAAKTMWDELAWEQEPF
jgi:2-dehydropantoate 2-reductase